MFKKTVLFVFALFFFVNAAWAAVNINKADQAALEALPGIGASKAAAIIEYRTKHGNFKTKEGLLEVKGIGPKVLESIQKDIEI
jgi:competence protein ComEA